MKQIKALLITLFAVLAAHAQVQLTVGSIEAIPSTVVTLPVNLRNTEPVTAVQFTMQLPEGVTLASETVTLSPTRTTDHVARVKRMAGGQCLVMIYSPTTADFLGNNGELLSFSLAVGGIEAGQTLSLQLSDILLAASDGSNVATAEAAAATITVVEKPVADLTVSNVASSLDGFMPAPSQSVRLSCDITNAGNAGLEGDYTVTFYWVEEATGRRVTAGPKCTYTGLTPWQVMNVAADCPTHPVVGVSGQCHVEAVVTAAGEAPGHEANNSAVSASFNIGSTFFVNALPKTLDEVAQVYMLDIIRSASPAAAQTVTVTVEGDGRVTCPAQLTFEAGNSFATLPVTVQPDGKYNPSPVFTITISAPGCQSCTYQLTLVDDTFPALSLALSSDGITEGDNLAVTLSTDVAPATDTPVQLVIDHADRFMAMPAVVIPAGQNSVTFTINTIDDDMPAAQEEVVTLKAAAAGYQQAEAVFALLDNDMPVIGLTFTPSTVSEGAGPQAVLATLTRTGVTGNRVIVTLTDDVPGRLTYSTHTVTLPEGVEQVQFTLGPVDNQYVEGDLTATITAAVDVSSCNCSNAATGYGAVQAQLVITDDDGPSLSLSSSHTALIEGGEGVTFTVARNTSTASALVVNLSSDHPDRVLMPATVTIPAGSRTATFTATAVANDVEDDAVTVVFTASADGFADVHSWLIVSDRTLADAALSDLQVAAEAAMGSEIPVVVTVSNLGVVRMPAGTVLNFYIGGLLAATRTTPAILAPGESVEVAAMLALPRRIGTQTVEVRVNEDGAFRELMQANNRVSTDIELTAAWTATLSIDKAAYNVGEVINLKGTAAGAWAAGDVVQILLNGPEGQLAFSASLQDDGSFATVFVPNALLSGHYTATVCSRGDQPGAVQAEFDVRGLKNAGPATQACLGLVGEPIKGTLTFTNPCSIAVEGITVTVGGNHPGIDCTVNPGALTVEPGGQLTLDYVLTSDQPTEGRAYLPVTITVKGSEGETGSATLYCYFQASEAVLKAIPASIQTTMQAGGSRDYTFRLTNVGRGSTGDITLALPSWMTPLVPNPMPAMEQGDTATVVLRLTPTKDMQLNSTQTGGIGINPALGTGLSMPYSIGVVGTAEGTLTVDVCDEYTYYTAEGPHVKGATVVVRHPSDNSVVAQGETAADGRFSATLTEGYYVLYVTAPRHESYRATVYVDPGTETLCTVNLSVQSITVDWKVEETEVEDEYTITTEVTYETNVPTPYVELSVPDFVDAESLSVGESLIFNATLTNRGLITAHAVQLLLPEGFRHIVFEKLGTDSLSLAPGQTIVVPVRVTRVSMPAAGARERNLAAAMRQPGGPRRVGHIDDDPCVGEPGTLYFWDCGLDRKWHRYGVALRLGSCGTQPTVPNPRDPDDRPIIWTPDDDDHDPGSWWHDGPGGGYLPWGDGDGLETSVEVDDCEPCQNTFLLKLLECGIRRYPPVNLAFQIYECVRALADAYHGEPYDPIELYERCRPDYGPQGWFDCFFKLLEPCDLDSVPASSQNVRAAMPVLRRAKAYPSYVQAYQRDVVQVVADAMQAYDDYYTYLTGGNEWRNCTAADMDNLFDRVRQLASGGLAITVEALADVQPVGMTDEGLQGFVLRINNFDINEATRFTDAFGAAHAKAVDMGYESLEKMYREESLKVYNRLTEDKANSVCASIKLKIDQKMVMTRQAFRGTLTVFNGHESVPMEDVELNLTIVDGDGTVATSHHFSIAAESLTGFGGEQTLDGKWTLDAKATGELKVLFIPTKYAAPTVPASWSFGGTLSYIDPFTGLKVTRVLTPVTLSVKPSPQLRLTYFMQRDVIADDPLTKDIVEPQEPAEFALLINNVGYGDATNVRIATHQPEIVDNEKGLAIGFSLLGGSLDGEPRTLALGGTLPLDFGTIKAGDSRLARWWLTSTLLGHFTEYKVEAKHVTSYGNPDLTLLDTASIHEMIHAMSVEGRTAYLVNDLIDADDLPDALYTQDGVVLAVGTATATATAVTDGFDIAVSTMTDGWAYGSMTDPSFGRRRVLAVRRSDGTELPADHFWQTSVTLIDGRNPLHESRLHFAVEQGAGTETYTVVYGEPVVEEITVALNISEALWATLTLPFDAELPEDVLAYSCDAVVHDGDSILLLDRQYSLEAGTPYVVRSNKVARHTFTGLPVFTDVVNQVGCLVGILEPAYVPRNDYVLQNGVVGPAFYLVTDEGRMRLAAYRAYLHLPTPSMARSLKMRIRDEYDTIENADRLPDAQEYFTPAGVPVTDTSRRGIYISRDRKIVVK